MPKQNLELMAMRWLWLEKDCHYIMEQRVPRDFLGLPDVIGITKARYLIEVEIKRTASDFRSDANKPHRRWMNEGNEKYATRQPKQIYYMMPRRLAERMLPEIPEWAGLMCDAENQYNAVVMKVAPSNHSSARLTLEECIRTVRLITNHMMTEKDYLETHFNRFRHGDSDPTDWLPAHVGTYSI